MIIRRNRDWHLSVSFTITTPPLLESFTFTTLTVFMRFETNLLFCTEHLSPSCHKESSRSSLPLHLRATSSRRFLPPDPFPSHHGTLWKLWNDKIYVLYIVSKSDALQYIYLSYLSSKQDLCLVIYIWDQYVIVHKRIYKIYQFCTRNSKLCAWNSQSNRRKIKVDWDIEPCSRGSGAVIFWSGCPANICIVSDSMCPSSQLRRWLFFGAINWKKKQKQ